ncbi:MAG: HDIG domain-containing protein [Calditrichaeota bacterium]|nr:MAG: HDIG domain-containing protein [Calditrichota bacterium]
MDITREQAYELLTEFTSKPALINHALSVEAAMRAYARKFGEDEEIWGIVGLLHDFDYEKYPSLEDHPFRGAEILRERGFPEEWIEAILGHAEHTGVPRRTLMAKTLYAVDELCGFITAVAYVRPNRKLEEVKVKSVKKKLKDKSFAAQVSREDIRKGAEELGVDFDEHIETVITAMQGIADQLGL